MGVVEKRFVLGVDLDGVCADFYDAMRHVAAEWSGRNVEELPEQVQYGLAAWGISGEREYKDLHRFAVTQRQLFQDVRPMPGAAAALRRLSKDGVRIRIITHRLIIEHVHQVSVAQTVGWLDYHGVPYWDLCFMKDKGAVEADLYLEDNPDNIEALRGAIQDVIVFTNSTNTHVVCRPDGRADDWSAVENLVRERLEEWTLRHPGM
jgi:5'(3')-deoxyribonucleotidase